MRIRRKKVDLLFFSLFFIELLLIICVPLFHLTLFGLSTEWSESLFIIFLFSIFAVSNYFYSKRGRKTRSHLRELEDRLRETFKYIGSVNLQIEELKKVFVNITRYPENKKELEATFINMATHILGIINTDWVFLKIVNTDNHSTLHEHFSTRGNKEVAKIKFSNECLLSGVCLIDEQVVISSSQDNFNIKAFCVLPVKPKDKNQEFMVKTVVNQLEMIFVIFNSLYYKRK